MWPPGGAVLVWAGVLRGGLGDEEDGEVQVVGITIHKSGERWEEEEEDVE